MLRRMTVLMSLLLTACAYAGQADLPLTSEDEFFSVRYSSFGHPFDDNRIEANKEDFSSHEKVDIYLFKEKLQPRQNKMVKTEKVIDGVKFNTYLINQSTSRVGVTDAYWNFSKLKEEERQQYKYVKGTFFVTSALPNEFTVTAMNRTVRHFNAPKPTVEEQMASLSELHFFTNREKHLYSFCLELPKNFRDISFKVALANATAPKGQLNEVYVINLRLTNSKEPNEIDKQIYEIEKAEKPQEKPVHNASISL